MLHLARRVPWLITRRLRRFDAPLLQYTSGNTGSGECLKTQADPLDRLLVLTDFVKEEVRRLDELVKPSNGISERISPTEMRQVAGTLGRSQQAMICISERDENERIKLALDSQPNNFQQFSIDRDILYFILKVDRTIDRSIFINPAGQFDNVPRPNDGIPLVKEIMIRPRDLDLPLGSVVSLFISNSFIIAVEDQEELKLVARPLYVDDDLDSDNTIFDQNTWFIKDRTEGSANFFFTSAAPNLQNICIVGGSENVPLELVNRADDPEICRPNLQQTPTGRLDRCRFFLSVQVFLEHMHACVE